MYLNKTSVHCCLSNNKGIINNRGCEQELLYAVWDV